MQALLYIIIDQFNIWEGAPFSVVGMNSILVYLLHEILGGQVPFCSCDPGSVLDSGQTFPPNKFLEKSPLAFFLYNLAYSTTEVFSKVVFPAKTLYRKKCMGTSNLLWENVWGGVVGERLDAKDNHLPFKKCKFNYSGIKTGSFDSLEKMMFLRAKTEHTCLN